MFIKNSDLVSKLKQEREAKTTALYNRAVNVISVLIDNITLDDTSFNYFDAVDQSVADRLMSELKAAGYVVTLTFYAGESGRLYPQLHVKLNLEDRKC